jgi:hypothetical protein
MMVCLSDVKRFCFDSIRFSNIGLPSSAAGMLKQKSTAAVCQEGFGWITK